MRGLSVLQHGLRRREMAFGLLAGYARYTARWGHRGERTLAATRSSLAVLLHADVVGSTTLVQRDERTAHERMQAAFRRLSECIARYHGTTHELRGDALVAEFSRASDAVCAALAFQQANGAANAVYDDPVRPEVRVGIALGEVVIADGTVTGAGVVLAQRLEQLAEPGGVSFSAAVREALPARLPLVFESLGEQSLKGFDEPVRAFRVAVRDGAALPEPDAVPARPMPTARRLRIAAAAGVILLVIAGWFGYAALRASADRPPGLGKPSLSLVVMPFANLGGDADQARAALAEFRRLQPAMTLARYRTVQTADDPAAIKAYARLEDGLRIAGLPES